MKEELDRLIEKWEKIKANEGFINWNIALMCRWILDDLKKLRRELENRSV